jgi:hypothetical protein
VFTNLSSHHQSLKEDNSLVKGKPLSVEKILKEEGRERTQSYHTEHNIKGTIITPMK